MPQTPRQASRDAALTELQRLHAAILASRAKRGVAVAATETPETVATRELTRRLQTPADDVAADPEPTPSRRWWWLAATAAVAAVAVMLVARTLDRRGEVVTEAAPPAAGPVSAPTPATAPAGAPAPAPAPPADTTPAATPGVAAEPATAPPATVDPARPVQLTLTAVRPVWLRITVDGRRALQREVAEGETLAFGADRAVVIRTGDAGAVRTTLNGADRGALGIRGWPLTVSITPDGIEPLTPTRPEP